MRFREHVAIPLRGAGVALLFAAWIVSPVSAAPASSGLEQSTPPAADQGSTQTLIGVAPAKAEPPSGPPPNLPPVPARLSEPLGPFTMDIEILASAETSAAGLLASPGCVSDSVYKRGMKLVFRFEVYDMDNRVRVTSADGSTAQITLPDGSTIPAYFVPRAAPGASAADSPWLWTAVWQIPTDYPLGPVLYTVDISTPDGRSATLEPPSIAGQPVQPDKPLAIAGTYPTIIP